MAELTIGEAAGFLNPALSAGLAASARKRNEKPGQPAKPLTKPGSFFSLMEKAGGEEVEGAVADGAAVADLPVGEGTVAALLDEVHSAADALAKHQGADTIVSYKKSVRRFINYVARNGFTLEHQDGIANFQKPGFKKNGDPARRMDHHVYSSLVVIDQKLERLAADILSAQMAQLTLLARIEEINGLLVDLLQ